jgi:hypothetical protein
MEEKEMIDDKRIMKDIEIYIKRNNEHIRRVMDYCRKQNIRFCVIL